MSSTERINKCTRSRCDMFIALPQGKLRKKNTAECGLVATSTCIFCIVLTLDWLQ